MKKKSLALALLTVMLLLLSACGASGNKAAMDSMAAMAPSASYAPEKEAPAEMDGSWESGYLTNVGKDIYNNPNNKIIRSARMVIQTTAFDETVAGLADLTEANGGYYETAEVQGGGYYDRYSRRTAYYVVRIPKENFIAFRNGAGEIGHLFSIVEDAQDVGETYYDTEARLATLTTKRDRLLALLEEATVMEDIITLEDALAEVLYEIDKHTATLRKYDSLINYSTFTITVEEVVKIVEEPKVEDSFGVKFVAGLKRGSARFGDNLQDFALWFAESIIGLVIFAAIVVVVVIFIRRRIRKARERRKTE